MSITSKEAEKKNIRDNPDIYFKKICLSIGSKKNGPICPNCKRET
jgi:hypothetical protein